MTSLAAVRRARPWLCLSSGSAELPLCVCVCVRASPRLQCPLLRSYCSATGYGWDYPDSEFRDVPLGFLLFLSRKLLLMVLTDSCFRLRPTGLSEEGDRPVL